MFYIMNAASIITATCDIPFVASRTNYLLLHRRPKDVLTRTGAAAWMTSSSSARHVSAIVVCCSGGVDEQVKQVNVVDHGFLVI